MQSPNTNAVPEKVVFSNIEELNQEAARRLVKLAGEEISKKGKFTLALSGGSTPQKLYTLLAGEPYRDQIDWGKVFVFWGDERCVPPDSPESNYRMANEALLSKVPLPASNIFRMKGEDPPAEAAESYTAQLEKFFGLEHGPGPSPENFPRFSLVLLGWDRMGIPPLFFPVRPLFMNMAGL